VDLELFGKPGDLEAALRGDYEPMQCHHHLLVFEEHLGKIALEGVGRREDPTHLGSDAAASQRA
jgi:hypothetical protein